MRVLFAETGIRKKKAKQTRTSMKGKGKNLTGK
jgi:hypothetical protein